MKQNEYFVFPNEATGFDPKEVDLPNPENGRQAQSAYVRIFEHKKLGERS